ncbi:ABC transporter related [Catenulispora acidiphila DSM 44928]|uniref:ABC transporter related n=1 Tax=Catenulispora acidiphila (strain DSM 44928 / JCM 14897 / NBRC 102108 / NRRL B-24433 / ID139908) TaxID=479433 RepID=C7QEE3_CATAD|nr:ABC transporter related [Catenulispora acidiphila DSM 44928]
MEDALRLESVSKTFGDQVKVAALDQVSLGLPYGTFTAVMGPSGSGKSTLLNCASGLERPDFGRVLIGGQELDTSDETAATRFRRGRIGFVFQAFNLLPTLTVWQNVLLPARIAGTSLSREDKNRARLLLDRVGLGDRLNHRPAELSGGQQQRVAIARAIVNRPALLFADEPTGALDSVRAAEVLMLIGESVREFGQTVVMVTHDPVAAAYADRVLFLADGRIVDEMRAPQAAGVAARMAAFRPTEAAAHVADAAHATHGTSTATSRFSGKAA